MKILSTDIYKLSIPMRPFTIATGTMHFAQNTYIRINTDAGISGVGECSAFPMIAGETQETCYVLAQDFARIWKGKDATDLNSRMAELHDYIAGNGTAKSAFDLALFDLNAKAKGLPLYKYLGGSKREVETDLTIGISTPREMADQAIDFRARGVNIIKVKLGKDPRMDVERIRLIRDEIGPDLRLRIDANQGWDFVGACYALKELAKYEIEFCEQPMRRHLDNMLPELRRCTPIPIMADESAFDHYEAQQLIETGSCDYVNIKFAKASGILESKKIHDTCAQYNIPCMMGGMLESRLALSAKLHFVYASPNIKFFDMDTCMLGHLEDPVLGGVKYNGFHLDIDDSPGIGADIDPQFLSRCIHTTI